MSKDCSSTFIDNISIKWVWMHKEIAQSLSFALFIFFRYILVFKEVRWGFFNSENLIWRLWLENICKQESFRSKYMASFKTVLEDMTNWTILIYVIIQRLDPKVEKGVKSYGPTNTILEKWMVTKQSIVMNVVFRRITIPTSKTSEIVYVLLTSTKYFDIFNQANERPFHRSFQW